MTLDLWLRVYGLRMTTPEITVAVNELIGAFGKLVVAIVYEHARRRPFTETESPAPARDYALLSKKQLAERIGVSARTLDTWIEQRRIPYLKIGRTVRFSLSEVSEHLKEKYRLPGKGWR